MDARAKGRGGARRARPKDGGDGRNVLRSGRTIFHEHSAGLRGGRRDPRGGARDANAVPAAKTHLVRLANLGPEPGDHLARPSLGSARSSEGKMTRACAVACAAPTRRASLSGGRRRTLRRTSLHKNWKSYFEPSWNGVEEETAIHGRTSRV